MRPRRDPEARRLPDDQRLRLKELLADLPDNPGPDDPAMRRLLDFGLTLEVPHWAPTNNALNYMIRMNALDVALDGLRRLADTDDWGEGPRRAEAPDRTNGNWPGATA